MSMSLFDNTKVASYFLWEHAQCNKALDLWYCAEDIARYFVSEGLCTISSVNALLDLDYYNIKYIAFVRHIAFRIHIYSGCDNELHNWYTAERLLGLNEWVDALVNMAFVMDENYAD